MDTHRIHIHENTRMETSDLISFKHGGIVSADNINGTDRRSHINRKTDQVLDCVNEQTRKNSFDTSNNLNGFLLQNVKVENIDVRFEVNSKATEDESMAVEALRQLGNSAVYSNSIPKIETKTPQDLPLLPCMTCHLEFRTTADLNNHSSICKHIQLDLNNHLYCQADKRYLCKTCNIGFNDKNELLLHMTIHATIAQTNQCQVCGISFNRSSSLTNHMKIHTYQAGRAIKSSSVVLENSQLPDLVLSNDGNETVDQKVYLPSLNNLIWNLCYDVTESDNCNVNVDLTNVNIDGALETKAIITQVSAKTNDNTNASPSQLKEDSDERPHSCMQCGKKFKREKALLSHSKLHSELLDKCYQCDICDKYLKDDNSLQIHVNECGKRTRKLTESVLHNECQRAEEKIGMDLNKEITEKQITRPDLVTPKVNTNHCDECGKSFSTKQKLVRHIWIHRKKIYSCKVCFVSFEKESALDSHRLTMHYKTLPYACSECGKNFSSRQGLWEHSRLHGDESNLFNCIECSKTFSSRQGYLIHKRKHNGERPYGCRFCWKHFRDGGTLRKHERIHTGEKPYTCPLCSRAFKQKVALREHIRWLHTANREPSPDGLYKCNLCELKLNDTEILCAHIVNHSDKIALLAKDKLKECDSEFIPKTPVNKRKYEKSNCTVLADKDDLLGLDQPAINCDLSGDKFSNKKELSTHISVNI